MAGGFACYHHCNDLDRASVATCSKCGKALCAECTDLFRSRNTGKILCIECLNAEIASNERACSSYAEKQKKEMIMMIVGGVIGFILAIILTGALGSAAFLGYIYLPFLFASLGLIWQNSFGTYGLIIGAVFFVGMVLVSPIMFVVRIVKRVKNRKVLAQIVVFNQSARKTNNEFFEYARSIKSGLTAAEMTKLVYQLQTTQTHLANAQSEMKKAKEDLARARESGNASEIYKLEQRLSRAEEQNANLQNQANSLEKQMNEDRKDHKEEQARINDEVSKVVNGMSDMSNQLNMMSVKKKSA